jgi:hypothetical protein
MKLIAKSTLLIAATLALLSPVRAEQGAMERAKELAAKAHAILKDNATVDKGGHRVAALKLLAQAIAEIEAGIAFDKANVTKSEGKKREDKKR